MEEIHKKTTNGIGHNSNILKDKSPTKEAVETYTKEQYEKVLNRFHYIMDFANHGISQIEHLFDEAFTGHRNAMSFGKKLKSFEIHEKRQQAKARADSLIKDLKDESQRVEVKAEADNIKLDVVEENKAAQEECDKENAKQQQ